jgi:hypothetical protein
LERFSEIGDASHSNPSGQGAAGRRDIEAAHCVSSFLQGMRHRLAHFAHTYEGDDRH